MGRVGIWVGLGLLISGCSFNLPARTCDSPGCATGDMASPVDLAPALPDPSVAGPYKVATAPVTLAQQPMLKSAQLYLPSDDGTTLSTKLAKYPLVLLAPAQNLDPALLGEYAQRLASHGLVVALYQVNSEGDQTLYRNAGLSLLTTLTTDLEPIVAQHIDATHVGLAGYQLGAEMSVTMASMMPTIRGMALIDPQVVSGLGTGHDLDGLAAMAQVKLTNGQSVLILGEDKSNTSMAGLIPCTNASTNYLQFYNVATSPVIALYFANAAHGEFTDSYPNPGCFGGTMDKAVTKSLAIKYLTAYFQWTLLERPSSQDYLTGKAFTADASRYTLTVNQKGQ